MTPTGKLTQDEAERMQMAEQLVCNTEDAMIFAVKKSLSDKHAVIEVFFANATTYEEAVGFLDELQSYLDQKFGIDSGNAGVN